MVLLLDSKKRETGIKILGKISWGTHFCVFYENKEDLLDILIPYFKEGLENNEYCMWITSEPLINKEAENAAKKVIPNFEHYLQKKQIEIVAYPKWYLKDNEFNSQRVLKGWIDKLNYALDLGYDGLRLTGNMFWLEKKNWKSFTDYEEEINNIISDYQMIAICTYSLKKCGSYEILDVIRNHQFALIRREGKWIQFKSMEQIKAEERLIKIERKLIESEQKLKLLISNIPAAVFKCDKNWTIHFISDSIQEITGYPPSDFIEDKVRTYASIIYPDDIKMVKEIASDCINKKIPIDIEYRILCVDGTIRWVYNTSQGTFDENGKLRSYNGLVLDITERKKAEQKLRESEEKFRTIAENSLIGICILQDNLIKYANQQFANIFGYSIEEIMSWVPGEMFKIIHPEDNDFIIEQATKKQNDLKDIINRYHFRGIRKTGEILWIEIYSKAISYMGRSADLTLLIDNTEKKLAEQELKKSEEKWRSLTENSNDFIIIADKNGTMQYINKTFPPETPEEVIGTTIYEYMLKEYHDVMRESLKYVYKTGKPACFETIFDTSRMIPKIDTIWFKTTLVPIKIHKTVSNVIMIAADITEQKKVEQELKEISRIKTELMRRTSHELKTPLISIKGFADLLLDFHYDKLDDDIIAIIKEIQNGCERLETLIKDILKTSQLDYDQIKLKPIREDLSFLIRFCVNELKILLKMRNQKIILNIPDTLIANFEKEKIFDVLSNLLTNAIKYSPPNSDISIHSEIKDDFIVVSVKDNGIGFTEEEKKRIFTQFGKIERYGQGWDVETEGSGLGLYLAKRIVELHDGKIWVESEGRNKGSIFYFSLPIIKD